MKRFRKRRGKTVEIPPKWVGRTTHPQTIRKRRSKMKRKHRRINKTSQSGTYSSKNRLKFRDGEYLDKEEW